MPGSRISRSRAMPARSRRCDPLRKKRRDAPPDLAGFEIERLGAPDAAGRVHDDEKARSRGQGRIQGGVRKASDVVQTGDAARQRETLRLRAVGIDGELRAAIGQRRQHRVEPADFLFRRHRSRRHIAGSGAEFDDVGALGRETAGMCNGRGRVEKPAPVGKRIGGDVDDTDQKGARHCSLSPARSHPGRLRSRIAPTDSASAKTSSFSTSTRTRPTRGSAKHASQTRAANPSHRSIWPECGDLADRGDDLLVIDDAAAIVAGKPGLWCRGQRDRDPHPLLPAMLGAADADAAHQHEVAHDDRIALVLWRTRQVHRRFRGAAISGKKLVGSSRSRTSILCPKTGSGSQVSAPESRRSVPSPL